MLEFREAPIHIIKNVDLNGKTKNSQSYKEIFGEVNESRIQSWESSLWLYSLKGAIFYRWNLIIKCNQVCQVNFSFWKKSNPFSSSRFEQYFLLLKWNWNRMRFSFSQRGWARKIKIKPRNQRTSSILCFTRQYFELLIPKIHPDFPNFAFGNEFENES